MAQFRRDTQQFQKNGNTIFEVVMLSTNTGVPISTTNRLPVSLGTGTITITGNVNVGSVVVVNSSPSNPVHNHITEVGTGGILTVPYLPVHDTRTSNVRVINQPRSMNVYSYSTSNVRVINLPASQNTNIRNSNGTSISLSDPISIQITKNGLAVSDTVALPTRVLNDEGLIAYARRAPVTESDVTSSYLIDKSGATETLGTTPATMVTVWDGTGLYPWNTFTGSGDKLYVNSSTDDPKVRGKTVYIEGLDSSYNLISETVTLNGSNSAIAVSTTNNFYRIVRSTLTGTNTNYLPHDYDIELHYGSSSGTIVDKITALYGRTQSCTYTVPAGYEAFVLAVNGSSGKNDEITSMIWTRPYNDTWHQIKTFKFISGTYEHNFRTPLRIPEKSDLEMRAYALVESSRVSVEFQLLIIPKV